MGSTKSFLQGVLRRLGLAGNHGSSPVVAGLLGPEEFVERLQQERLRADRTHSHFTLVLFSVPAEGVNAQEHRWLLERLAVIIRDRSRRSDVKGFYGDARDRIGLMLPNTRSEEALVLVHAVEDRFINQVKVKGVIAGIVPEITCDVYAYPEKKEAQIFEEKQEGSCNGMAHHATELPLMANLSAQKIQEERNVI
ncbi:MAG: hypothetical protein ACE15F_10490 [bacterium]